MKSLFSAIRAVATVTLVCWTTGAAPWERSAPAEVGLSPARLHELQQLAGGRGCVIRKDRMAWSWGDIAHSGDLASAFKPLLSTLLLIAVQEGRINSADDRVAEFEPRLSDGKDAAITWRHLASQLSGYGLVEMPGVAYAYNDYALALYYDTLMHMVFKMPGDAILKTRLAEPLEFEDRCTFDAFGPRDRPGRLALSVRDFARFGVMILRNGKCRDKTILKPDLLQMMLNSPIPPETPLTSGKEAPMLPGQRTIGGSRNITPVGPGYYSFNWWLNRTNSQGQRLFPGAPPDTIVASGHGGKRMLWIIPSLDLVVCWNDSRIDDHDKSPGNRDAKCNQAARLISLAVAEGAGRSSKLQNE